MLAAAPRLLVFDLDGTLIDSSLDLCHAVNAALAHVGRPVLPHGVVASYVGDGAAMLVRRALGEPDELQPGAEDGLFQRTYEYFIGWYREHKLDNTVCYAGVLESLAEIRGRHPGLPMAVLTNKPVAPSREICAALGLAPFFFQNYGGNSFATKKPDPEGLLTLMAEASVLVGETIEAAETVMIGDSDVDVLTAKRCGARSVGCSYGLAPHSLAAAGADAVVGSALEWVGVLGL